MLRADSVFSLCAALLAAALPAWPQLVIDTVAGGKMRSGVPADEAGISLVRGMAWDGSGGLTICETNRNLIRRIRSGVIETVVGNGTTGFSPDGARALDAALNGPSGCSYDSAGNLYFYESANGRIRRVSTEGVLTTVAGNGTPYRRGQPVEGHALSLALDNIYDVAAAPDGIIYFTTSSGRIQKVTTAGRIVTVSERSGRTQLAVDAQGNLYVAVEGFGTGAGALRIAPDGSATEVAGFGAWTGTPEDDEPRRRSGSTSNGSTRSPRMVRATCTSFKSPL
jgi:hypothetical protein